MKKALSKEEFVRRVMTDLAAVKKVITPRQYKRKCIVKRSKCHGFDMVERLITYEEV